ncbi:uncharacterized protein DUF3649 [Delftia acidovorans]|nr:uncharacterized protein DUF3649 [Delftia acidovorans]
MYEEGLEGRRITASVLAPCLHAFVRSCAYPNTHYMPQSQPADPADITQADRPVHPGLLVLSRLLAAVFGGYALASALAAFLAAALPGARVDAVIAGMQWSFALHALAVIWAFSPVSAGRVWLGLLVPAALMGGAALLLARNGGGV